MNWLQVILRILGALGTALIPVVVRNIDALLKALIKKLEKKKRKAKSEAEKFEIEAKIDSLKKMQEERKQGLI